MFEKKNYPVDYQVRYRQGEIIPELDRELEILKQIFRLPEDANYDKHFVSQHVLSLDMERWILLPSFRLLGRSLPLATQLALNVCRGSLGCHVENHLTIADQLTRIRTASLYAYYRQRQNGQILAIPMQFGELHINKSVRRVCRFANNQQELLVGLYETIIWLALHKERLRSANDLQIICPADRHRLGVTETIYGAPAIEWNSNRDQLVITNVLCDKPQDGYGIVTAFTV